MALQVEDMHHALPNGLAGSYLFKGKRIDKHDLSAVLAFNGSLSSVRRPIATQSRVTILTCGEPREDTSTLT